MTARLHDRELDTLLAGWLDEGPTTAAGFVLEQALARVPTVRRRAGRWPQLPTVLRTHGPLLAAVAVLLVLAAGAALAIGSISRPQPVPPSPPVVPSLDASASPATPEPSPSATAAPIAYEAEGEVRTPSGSVPAGSMWMFQGAQNGELPWLGYQFNYGCCGAKEFYFRIYLEPGARDWVGTWNTDGRDLKVLIAWQLIAPFSVGTFPSVAGECEVTFETFTETIGQGHLMCRDVPGTYLKGTDPQQEGIVELLEATFTFNPSWQPPGGW